jgi:hypothetical protein
LRISVSTDSPPTPESNTPIKVYRRDSSHGGSDCR